MEDVAVAETAAHALGLAPLRPGDWAHFVKDSVFEKRRANAMFVVESVNGEVLRHFHGLQTLAMSQGPVPIVESALLQDETALISSLASGLTVAQHGIVGTNWFTSDGDKVSAFEKPASMSQGQNLADRLEDAFHGQSLVVSASSRAQCAVAMGVHPATAARNPYWNAYSMSWNAASERFESLYPHQKATPFDEASILQFSHLQRVLGAVRTTHAIKLAHGEQLAHFSLRHPHSVTFLTELEFVLSTIAALKADPALAELTADSAPDAFSFCFASLRFLKASFAPTTETFQVALHAVDRVIAHSIEQLSLIYKNRLMWEVAFVDQTNVIKAGEAIINQVSQALTDTNTLAFGVDVFALSRDSQAVCDKLNAHLQSKGLVAHCPVGTTQQATVAPIVVAPHWEVPAEEVVRAIHTQWARQSNGGSNSSGNGTNTGNTADDSLEYVITFQLIFWISIILFVLFLYGVATIAEVIIPNDSQLLRNLPDIYKPLGTQPLRELGDQ